MDDNDLTPDGQTKGDASSLEITSDAQNQTLESSGSIKFDADSETGVNSDATTGKPAPPPNNKGNRFAQLRERLNIYLLMFGSVLLLAGVIILIAYLQSRQTTPNSHLKTQSISQATLEQLAEGDASVGSSKSILNVQSSAVFAGQVLIRQNLQVAGNIQIGGTLSLNNLTVSGTSQFGQAVVNKDLAVAGNTSIQGATTIAKTLQVSGGGTFGGPISAPQITAGKLQLNGDLVLTHHITAGGATPSRSGGSALGGGGSVSISGSDTAGSISINTGGGPAAGCFVTVNFTSHYNATPHVIVTPIGSAAGGLSYYVNRSTSNFSVCVSSPPPGGSSFGFDYFVVD